MSGWRDNLRRVTMADGRRLIGASFRGVPFFVESSDRGGGRRAPVVEFPYRDDPFVDDLGRKARTFQVEGYVLGDDYVAQRDALLSALEDQAGPGELVHPYHGIRRAVCSNFNVREARSDGRVAVIAIDFTEAPAQNLTPSTTSDLAGQVDASANAALAATDEEFQQDYDAEGMPSFALESASNALRTAAAALQTALGPVVRGTQEMAKLTSDVNLITSQASSLVRTPGQILAAFSGAIAGLADAVADAPRGVWQALLDTYDLDFGSVLVTLTDTREREAANLDALAAALRRVFVTEAARLTPSIVFESLDDALAGRTHTIDRLLEEEAVAGDTAYPALVQLRADVSRAVPGDAILARLVTIEKPVAVPSILLAYQLYGSTALELDVVARNGAIHPGFLSGTLKVLSRG